MLRNLGTTRQDSVCTWPWRGGRYNPLQCQHLALLQAETKLCLFILMEAPVVTVSPLCPPLFSWIHASMLLSVAGLVLGAPEACSQSPSSQPSRGLLPCTAPQPPPQPPPQAPGLPPAQQQPAMSSPMMSQVSPTGCTGRGEGRARGIPGCSGFTSGFEGPHTHCPTGLCCAWVILWDIPPCQLCWASSPPGKGSVALG